MERNLLAKRFLSIPFFILSSERKNFRVSDIFSADRGVSSFPIRPGEFKSLFNLKTRFSIYVWSTDILSKFSKTKFSILSADTCLTEQACQSCFVVEVQRYVLNTDFWRSD
ncbi:MAG: hypothetical protein FJZ07_02665 [Candidatus Nealsonbacteria bacterium]|nr:hypothetical protein [Candidatus Nealsonbacteria bacterium]